MVHILDGFSLWIRAGRPQGVEMLIVDRIEGDVAVVETGVDTFEDVPVDDIRGAVRVGAVLCEVAPGEYVVSEDETDERARHIQAKARRLFR